MFGSAIGARSYGRLVEDLGGGRHGPDTKPEKSPQYRGETEGHRPGLGTDQADYSAHPSETGINCLGDHQTSPDTPE